MEIVNRFNMLNRRLEQLHVLLQQKQQESQLLEQRYEQTKALGHSEDSFIMRRLQSRLNELTRQFDAIKTEINSLLNHHLEKRFLSFDSAADVEAMMSIRTRIRGLNASFSHVLPIAARTLAKLNQTLPSRFI